MRFASDNAGPVHPKIIQALTNANEGWAMPYGNEDLTRAAAQNVRDVFEAPDAAVYFVATGTAANSILLATMTRPFQTIFCTPEAHIEEDECNAPEFYTGGAKLTLIESKAAKMDPATLARTLEGMDRSFVHGAQPGPVSLTQITERGTAYSLSEINDLCAVAKAHDLSVHLDGARFANAIAALGCTPAEMSWKAGVDAVSFGGTKNGCMGVEAAVIFDPALAWEFELRRKRGGHLFSKNRYLAAQMVSYLEDDLWLDMARKSNDIGQKLSRGLGQIPEVTFLEEPAANMIFAEFPRAAHKRLQAAGAHYYAMGSMDGPDDEPVHARLVADWSCPDSHVEDFLALVRG